MKYGITAALALATLAPLAGAQAQENESGFYAGAGIGTFDVKINDFDDVDDNIYDSDDTAWKAFAGWRMNQYLGFELAYVNLGSPDDEIVPDLRLTTETDGFAPYVVGTLPLGDWFELFAKAGYYWYDTEARLTTPLGTTSASESNETFTWTAGAGLNVFEHVNLRVEYEQFDFDEADDASALWLTAGFRF